MVSSITADFQTLMRQAPATAEVYLRQGKIDIDSLFGDGYAKGHPELLAAYMKTAAIDMMTATIAKEIGGAIDEIAEAIAAGCSAISGAM